MDIITANCQLCGQSSIVTLTPDQYIRYQGPGVIQDRLPELDSTTRELLISGTHGPCWNELFFGIPEED